MQRPEPGRVQWQFNMGGVTTHITQALAHVASYMPTGALPRTIPTKARSTFARTATGNWWSMAWTSAGPAGRSPGPTHWIPYASFTPAYVRALYLMVVSAPVNNAAWRVWAPGEVRILGVSGISVG